ncbi:glycosyltransferase family 2 protein [Kiloniella majae]|uniref:glycosyltransferase family 2 protein n=1 Tax=Kiloniella majae TaxID=1938558 RepID=UPI000A277C50|nr:glycosyltransferase family 2 protein [Kiloniella majae]
MTDISSKILIIVPSHNEEANLPGLLDEIFKTGADVVVINDASSDNTEQVARDKGIQVLSLPVNLGIGGGVQTGFMYAVRNNYDIAVQLDGDGQHDPSLLAKVTAPVISGEVDCVIGSRYLPSDKDENYKTPVLRRLGMHFSTGILKLASGLVIHDTTSGYRALNRGALEYFVKCYPTDHPEAEALLMLQQAGFRIREVGIKMRTRNNGESLFTFWKAAFYPLRVIIGFIGVFSHPWQGNKK